METLGNSVGECRRVPDHSGRSGAAATEGKEAGGRVPLVAAARVQVKHKNLN